MEEVLKHLTPVQSLSLSWIGTPYLRRTIHRLTRRNPFDLLVNYTPNLKMICFDVKKEEIPMDALNLSGKEEETEIDVYKRLLILITSRFHCRSIRFDINHSSDYEVMGMMRVAFDLRLKLAGFSIYKQELPFSISYFLSKCEKESDLRMYTNQSISLFIHNFNESPLELIRVKEGSGIKINTLISMMNCRKIDLSRIYTDGHKLNRLIKRWIRNSNYRLESMKLKFDLHRLDTNYRIMEGIEATRMSDDSYSIQGNDGRRATVYFDVTRFEMKVDC